jgi:hypothetical protein
MNSGLHPVPSIRWDGGPVSCSQRIGCRADPGLYSVLADFLYLFYSGSHFVFPRLKPEVNKLGRRIRPHNDDRNTDSNNEHSPVLQPRVVEVPDMVKCQGIPQDFE